MLRILWNYLKGYVLIEISCSTVEKFLNMATYREIELWHIESVKGKTIAKVSIKNFRKLKDISRKTNCKYKIVGRVGTPFLFFRYRKRKILLFGLPIFLGLLYFLTSFIWAIDIIGYEKIKHEDIIQAVETQGITLGTFRRNINKHAVEEYLLNEFENMSFVNIAINGTRAVITISENIPEAIIVDRTTPIQLVSNAAGIIYRIELSAGEALVVPGDIVRVGDVLVTGFVQPDPEATPGFYNYVHSAGVIYAYVYYSLEFTIPREVTENVPTGQVRRTYTINILNNYINLPNFFPNFEKYDIIINRAFLNFGENYPLPFVLIMETQYEYQEQTRIRSLAEMENLAAIQLQDTIVNFFDFETDIDRRRVTKHETENGLLVNVGITTIQNIAIEEEMQSVPESFTQENEEL